MSSSAPTSASAAAAAAASEPCSTLFASNAPAPDAASNSASNSASGSAPDAPDAPSAMPPASSSIGPMCLYVKDHCAQLATRLLDLRSSSSLVDLDIVCGSGVGGDSSQVHKAHKAVAAAASKFFRDQLCRANVNVPVLLRLEDFGLGAITSEAVGYVLEFAYRGEVVIPGERLSDVCAAAHALEIHGLVEFLPQGSRSKPACVGRAAATSEALTSTMHLQQVLAQDVNE